MSKRLFQIYVEKAEVSVDKQSSLMDNISQILRDKLVEFMKGVFDSGDKLMSELKEGDPAKYAATLLQYPELADSDRPSDEDFAELAKENNYEDEVFGWKYAVNDEGFCVSGFLELQDKTKNSPIVLSSWVELGINQGLKVSDRIIND